MKSIDDFDSRAEVEAYLAKQAVRARGEISNLMGLLDRVEAKATTDEERAEVARQRAELQETLAELDGIYDRPNEEGTA